MKAYFLFKAPGNSTLFKKVSLEEVLETWIFLGQCGHAAWGAACGGLGRGPRCGKGPCARPGSTMVPGATTSAPGGGGLGSLQKEERPRKTRVRPQQGEIRMPVLECLIKVQLLPWLPAQGDLSFLFS